MRLAPLFGAGEHLRDGYLLRRMTSEDLSSVELLLRRAFSRPWSRELIEGELSNECSTVLLAFQSGNPTAQQISRQLLSRLVGFVVLWVVHDELQIQNVAVDPDERRRGIARVLLSEVLLRARGVVSLATLEVRKSNSAAIGLYESLGFHAIAVRRGYYAPDGEDAIVMERGVD